MGEVVGGSAHWQQVGLSRPRMKTLVQSGDLVRVRYGCYATKDVLADAKDDPCLDHAIKVAALMAASRRRDCVASHHSAARMHGLELLHPPGEDIITITVPPGRKTGRARETDVVRHAARIPGDHITDFRGVPVTTMARTVADIARTSAFVQGVVIADSAMRRDPTVKPQIRAVLQECQGWPGVDLARKVTEFAEWAPETPLESSARAVFHEHGLPPPLFQAPILGVDGRLAARADFCWPEYGTIAEADGADKYRIRGDFKAHHQRDSRIWMVGWEVAHFLWDELFADPADVVARIRFAFERGTEPAVAGRRARFPQAVVRR
ncbi:MAG: hypothetical protein FWE35_24580 [Streptosporangiales bacterium]|nr:hypothetical protein [Streptosporangiales bacterium]